MVEVVCDRDVECTAQFWIYPRAGLRYDFTFGQV